MSKKSGNAIDNAVSTILAKFKQIGAQLIVEKMQLVNKPEYLEEKQRLLDQNSEKLGKPRVIAGLGKYEFLRIMTEDELQTTLLALLPVLSLEETPSTEKCKYLIGTQSGVLMIRTTNVMIRVGGGFASLEDYLK